MTKELNEDPQEEDRPPTPEEMPFPTPEQAVANGARFLDEHEPDWQRFIDLSDLRMSSGRYCILGQIGYELELGYEFYDNLFVAAMVHYSLDYRDNTDAYYGFNAPTHEYYGEWNDIAYKKELNVFSLLEKLWTAEVIERRGKDTSND